MSLFSKTILTIVITLLCFKHIHAQQLVDTTILNKGIDTLHKSYAAGNYKQTITLAGKWLWHANRLKHIKASASIHNILGNCYLRLGKYDSALQAAIKAEQLHTQIHNKRGIFSTLLLKANVYFFTQNYVLSKSMYYQAYRLATAINYQAGIGKATMNLGMLFNEEKQTDSALHYLDIATTAFEQAKDAVSLNNVYSNIGIIYFDQAKYQPALQYYQKAFKQANLLQDQLSITVLNINIGATYYRLGKHQQAITILEPALTQAALAGLTSEKLTATELLAEAYYKVGNAPRGFLLMQQAFKLKDSIYTRKQAEAVAEITNSYELALKDAKINTLQKEQQIQQANYKATTIAQRNKLTIAFIVTAVVLAMAVVLYFFLQQRQKQQLAIIEKEKVQAELQGLKSQLNPHVLFNSLNTIYFQIDDDINVAKATILKYADLLRYQLYQTNERFVPLANEISFIKKFIDIQRLRISERCNIDVAITEQPSDYMIAPLLLINVIENAFKYVTNVKGMNNFIRIQLLVENQQLILTTANSTLKNITSNNETGGVGISNLVKRLQLIYPNQHELLLQHDGSVFTVRLTIDLTRYI
jgi:tetratricopeptide (TPR) repeat protein